MANATKAPRPRPTLKRAEAQLGLSLYLHEGCEIPEIATRLGVNIKTVYAWRDKHNWEKLRAAQHMGKDNQLERVQLQLAELNDNIAARPEGMRFPNSREADIIRKLTASCRDLETKLGLRELVDVSVEFIPWVKTQSAEDARLLKAYLDRFMQHKLAQQ